MDGVIAIIIFCCVIGTVAICLGLIISGILRWLAPLDKREGRLNIAAWIAGTVLAGGSVLFYSWKGLGDNRIESVNVIYLKVLYTLIVFLFATVTVASIVELLLLIGKVMLLGWKIIVHAKDQKKGLKEEADDYKDALNNPAVMFTIAWGILAIFLMLPFFTGEQGSGPIDTWVKGTNSIAVWFDLDAKNANQGTLGNVGSYILLYIIVMGVGVAVIKIFYSLIKHLFKKENNSFIDEYSNPMALMAVGVALLWSLRLKVFLVTSRRKLIFELFKCFAAVIIVFTIAILTLEIIRLLMDMREKIIRQEARYLFIFLVGQCTMMLMDILTLVCGALDNSVNGLPFSEMFELEDKMREKMNKIINDEVDGKTDLKAETHQGSDPHRTFLAFSARTKKK